VRELLESFGGLKGFDLVKDRETGNSKGYAFCVYQDLSVTDIACAALNGIKMGDKTLTVRRANQGTMLQKPEQENVLLHAQQQIAFQRVMLQPGAVATTVVCLTQVVTEDELRDDEEYGDIMEDMRQEGGKFGKRPLNCAIWSILKYKIKSILICLSVFLVVLFYSLLL
jgi:splicing factor U2AF subunit